jgi:chemotaxis protein MotB
VDRDVTINQFLKSILHLQKLLFFFLLLTSSCIKPKIYKAELVSRQQSEARETVLNRELSTRKTESTLLIEQVGALNRTIGNQETEIKVLQSEVNEKSTQFGESSVRLQSEKDRLTYELLQTKEDLKQKEADLNQIYAKEALKKDYLISLHAALNDEYSTWFQNGVRLDILDKKIELTLPDVQLFDPNGLTINANGYALLEPLAQFLTNRPSVDVQIICYTDNTLPREKAIKDSWDWSLVRSTNIARMLLREYSVNANQMTPIGRGEFYPSSSNETAEGRSENRRTVVQILVE